MTIHLITGRAGEPHVTSVDAGKFNANVFGRGRYVLDGCECTVIDSNNLSIAEGVMLVDGRQVNIEGTGEPVVIENGQSGYNRIDLVCLRYQRSEGIETIDISTIKGQPTSGEPVAPTGSGSIIDGDSLAYIPIFSVRITGTNVEQPIMMLESFALYTLGLGEEIPAGANLDDYTTPGIYRLVADVADVQNSPIEHGFTLVVSYRINEATISQVLYPYNTSYGDGTCWERTYIGWNTPKWTNWVCSGGVDAIVAEGTTNNWTWKKYASGRAEAFTKFSVSDYTFWSYGSGFRAWLGRYSMPFNLVGGYSIVANASNPNIYLACMPHDFTSDAVSFHATTEAGPFSPAGVGSIEVCAQVDGWWK